MPIGNVTSQLFANIYLQDLDFYVENIVKPKFRKQNKNLFYIRYVDDFVFLAEEKADLIQIKDEILEFLKTNLRLSVSPKKLVLNNVSCGIPFLRYIIWDRKLKIKNDTIRRFKKRIRFYPIEKKLESLISFKGHCELAKTKLISELFFSFYRKRVINIYKHRIEIFILYDSERGFRERIQREDSERGFRERIQREDSERGFRERIGGDYS